MLLVLGMINRTRESPRQWEYSLRLDTEASRDLEEHIVTWNEVQVFRFSSMAFTDAMWIPEAIHTPSYILLHLYGLSSTLGAGRASFLTF